MAVQTLTFSERAYVQYEASITRAKIAEGSNSAPHLDVVSESDSNRPCNATGLISLEYLPPSHAIRPQPADVT